MEINNQTKIIVTGASRGIGRSLVEELVGLGAQVLGVGRSEDELKSLSLKLLGAPGTFSFLIIDLHDPQSRARLVRWVKRNWGRFDVLVNNAGIVYSERVSQSKMEKIRGIMEVNFFAPIEFLIKLLPLMKTPGMVINMLSPAVYRNHPLAGFYAASKAALKSVTLAIKRDVKERSANNKLFVLGYYPGFVKTGIIRDKQTSPLVRLLQVDPEYTAARIISVIKTNKEGEYYEPAAWILKMVGLLGF